jgi:hypothetical protein
LDLFSVTDTAETDAVLADWRAKAQEFETRVARVVLGQNRVIRLVTK